MRLTWFDANSWLVEAEGWRILIDPWLVGDLVFANVPWLVKGVRSHPISIPENIDFILLSQGLADHAHPETLKQLDKSIPVIASPDGAKVAEDIGYASVTVANHGDRISKKGPDEASNKSLTIETLEGAVVGATKRENGYVITFSGTQSDSHTRLYYEPHGYPDFKRLQEIDSIDVVITPVADIRLMKVAPVVRGGSVALDIAQKLKPQVVVPTAENGRVTYEGLISSALQTSGGSAELRSQLQAINSDTQVIQPVSGEPFDLVLRSSVTAS